MIENGTPVHYTDENGTCLPATIMGTKYLDTRDVPGTGHAFLIVHTADGDVMKSPIPTGEPATPGTWHPDHA